VSSLTSLTTLVSNSAVKVDVLGSELVWEPAEKADDISDDIRERVGALVADLEDNEDCLRVFTSID
jgi:transcriptional/translational regulatory protein YebC/TACO1